MTPRIFGLVGSNSQHTVYRVNERESFGTRKSIEVWRDDEWQPWGWMLAADLERNAIDLKGDAIDMACSMCGGPRLEAGVGSKFHVCSPDALDHAQKNLQRRWSCCCRACTVLYVKLERIDAIEALPCDGCGTPCVDCRCDADEREHAI